MKHYRICGYDHEDLMNILMQLYAVKELTAMFWKRCILLDYAIVSVCDATPKDVVLQEIDKTSPQPF
jgi:hypothetical protein